MKYSTVACAPAGMGKRGHLPPFGNVVKCFCALVFTAKHSVDELFMHYFYNLSSASGGFASRPPAGLHSWRSIHERSYDSSPTYAGRTTSIPHHLLFTKNGTPTNGVNLLDSTGGLSSQTFNLPTPGKILRAPMHSPRKVLEFQCFQVVNIVL